MRTNVYTYPGDNDYDEPGTRLAGWFNADTAIRYEENTRWDGQNNISVATGSQWDHQALYRTKGGRWVLNAWSQWQGREARWEFVTDDTAKDWLLRNDRDDAVEEWFGTLADESGPRLGGRPVVGTKVETRFPEDVLDALDQRAIAEGASRAEMIRRLVTAGLERTE